MITVMTEERGQSLPQIEAFLEASGLPYEIWPCDDSLAEEAAEAASEAEVNAALDQIAAADLAGIAAAEAAAATKEAWENINPEDLAEATAYAAEFAAQEAAKIIEHQNIDSQLQDLIDSGASAEQIAEFEANNPAPE